MILLQPHYGHHDALFKGRYDDPLGAAIEFTTETERKLQRALGNNFHFIATKSATKLHRLQIDFLLLLRDATKQRSNSPLFQFPLSRLEGQITP